MHQCALPIQTPQNAGSDGEPIAQSSSGLQREPRVIKNVTTPSSQPVGTITEFLIRKRTPFFVNFPSAAADLHFPRSHGSLSENAS
jgi:hypothetical protein